jgi:hypothetical protein
MAESEGEATMEFATHWRVGHTCGHEQVHDLTNKPEGARTRVAAWLAGRKCTDCKLAEQQDPTRRDWRDARREQMLAQIGEWEARVGMPVLEGSEKSVAWGREVRFKLLATTYDYFNEEGHDETEFIVRVELPATEMTSATWWIERRETFAIDVESLLTAALSQGSSSEGDESRNGGSHRSAGRGMYSLPADRQSNGSPGDTAGKGRKE